MLFKVQELNTGATGYIVNLYTAKLPEYGLPSFCFNDFKSEYSNIWAKCKRDGVSCYVGFSKTDSETAQKKYLKTGKRGRPRTLVEGDPVSGHIHMVFVGSEKKSARKTAEDYKDSVNKRYKKRGFPVNISSMRSVSDGIELWDYVHYIEKQSFPVWSAGDFDFKDYLKRR